MTPRLKIAYDKEIINKLMSKLSVKNKHQVPRIEKIILNMGLGEDASDGKKLKACVDDLALIAGQRPIITKFKKSISVFSISKSPIIPIPTFSFSSFLIIISRFFKLKKSWNYD